MMMAFLLLENWEKTSYTWRRFCKVLDARPFMCELLLSMFHSGRSTTRAIYNIFIFFGHRLFQVCVRLLPRMNWIAWAVKCSTRSNGKPFRGIVLCASYGARRERTL